MITENKGDLLLNFNSGFMIHFCNAQGVMGGGIAKKIKIRYPEAFNRYKYAYFGGFINDCCEMNTPELKLGTIIPVRVTDSLVIINAVTQRYYKNHKMANFAQTRFTDYEAVAVCLSETNKLVDVYSDINKTLAFPKYIGCGLGGGNWNTISSMIDSGINNMLKESWES